MELELQGKVAIVTGASRGIGAAIAGEFAREGADLFLVAGSEPDLMRVAGELRETTGRMIASRAADLQSLTAADEVVQAAITVFKRIDVLVNCAGNTRSGHVFEVTNEDWRDAFSVKFHGTLRMCRSAWPHLRATQGCIVNVAGNTARTGCADHGINGAVNAALLNLTKSLADLGTREGVRVNAINPGRIATRRLVRALDKVVQEHSLTVDEAAQRLLQASGTARFGEPREIGWLVAYLASPRAAFIQGAIVEIDGGETRAI